MSADAVIGGSGFVGSALVRYGNTHTETECISITRDNYKRWCRHSFRNLFWAAGSARKDLPPDVLHDLNATAVARALRDFEYDKFIYISSQAVYPAELECPDETAEILHLKKYYTDPYGHSKIIGEANTRRIAENWLILRPNGFVGVGLKKNVIHSLAAKNPPETYYSWNSKFQIIHTDTFAVLCIILAAKYSNRVFNVTSPEVITPIDVANILGIDLKAVVQPRDRVIPHVNAILDVTKLMEALKTFNVCLPKAEEAIRKWNQPFLNSINVLSADHNGLLT